MPVCICREGGERGLERFLELGLAECIAFLLRHGQLRGVNVVQVLGLRLGKVLQFPPRILVDRRNSCTPSTHPHTPHAYTRPSLPSIRSLHTLSTRFRRMLSVWLS